MRKHLLIILMPGILVWACGRFTTEEKAKLARGSEVYLTHCVSCHGTEGDGLQGAYPTLLKPEIAKANTDRAIHLIRIGSGVEGGMKPIALTDKELVEVVNYIQNTWGNESPFITETTVQELANK
ncbi:MAG: cytochrome c [Cyclobacteriaceae bacterium]